MMPRFFGSLPGGAPVEAYTLTNAAGLSLEVLTFGGIVTSLRAPDRQGRFADVVLGLADLSSYAAGHPYFGAITGRIAGRVTAGRILVEGRTHQLPLTSPQHHLHGGLVGLDQRIWTARPVRRGDGADSLQLTYHSPDGEEGYPGNVDVSITYTLTADNAFIVESAATADRPTPLALTHHSYFNLAGEGSGSVADHEIEITARDCVPMDEAMTLLGRREPVAGRAMDFNRRRRLGDALPHLFQAHGGLFALRAPGESPPAAPTRAARITEPGSGRALEVFTDESFLQFYTGSALDGSKVGKSGRPYGPHAGLCLECQGYPDATTRTGFGDILVHPVTPQRRTTVYAFSTF